MKQKIGVQHESPHATFRSGLPVTKIGPQYQEQRHIFAAAQAAPA
jgi:hypothetical protein